MSRFGRLVTGIASVGATVGALLVASSSVARAQDAAPACVAPTAGDSDPVASAEQALCWIDRARASGAACPDCMEHAARHCEHASLDLSPQVANACFVARVAVGRFEDAARVVPLLTEAWPEVERCRRVFSSGIELRVRTDAQRAEVLVNGRSMGSAPTLVELPHPFWEARVGVRFGRGPDAQTVERAGASLLDHFDRARCTMTDLVVDAPARTSPPERTGRTIGRRASPVATHTRDSGSSVPGLVFGVGGLAVGSAGAIVLAAAASTAAALRDAPDGTPWTAARMDDYDTVGSMRVTGTILVGLGATALVIGTYLILSRSTGDRPPERARARRRPRGPRLEASSSGLRFEMLE